MLILKLIKTTYYTIPNRRTDGQSFYSPQHCDGRAIEILPGINHFTASRCFTLTVEASVLAAAAHARNQPDATNGVFVCLVHFHIVHVVLPVFNEASMLACHHPVPAVVPHHRSYGCVMCLSHNHIILFRTGTGAVSIKLTNHKLP